MDTNGDSTLQRNYFFYKNNDATQAAYKFEDTVFKKIKQLTEHPLIGRPTRKFKTVRMIKLDAHRQMTYRVKGKTLFITNFWDTRRDPNQRPF